MSSEYFISTGYGQDDVKGPLTLQQVQEAITKGEVLPDTMVTLSADSGWKYARDVREIQKLFEEVEFKQGLQRKALKKAGRETPKRREEGAAPQKAEVPGQYVSTPVSPALSGIFEFLSLLSLIAALLGCILIFVAPSQGLLLVISGLISSAYLAAFAQVLSHLKQMTFRLENIEKLMRQDRRGSQE